jgi:hypothetical protein
LVLAGSPLIDRGEPALPAGTATTDLAGAPRVAGGRTDIGAYEYQPPVAPISAPSGAAPEEQGTTGAGGTTTPPALAGSGRTALPKLLLSASARQRLDRRGRFAVRATCAAALGCRGTLKLTAGHVTLGTARVALRSGARGTFHIRLTRAGRALLKRHATLKVAVRASVRDAHGTALPARTAFSLRRR